MRLTFSIARFQSVVETSRRPVIELPMDACPMVWSWCSVRTASSTLEPTSLSRRSSSIRSSEMRGPSSRVRWTRWTTNALVRFSGRGGRGSPGPIDSKPMK